MGVIYNPAKLPLKKLYEFLTEFAGRHNVREMDAIDRVAFLAEGMVCKKLPYKEVIS